MVRTDNYLDALEVIYPGRVPRALHSELSRESHTRSRSLVGNWEFDFLARSHVWSRSCGKKQWFRARLCGWNLIGCYKEVNVYMYIYIYIYMLI
jgi:hypothetical protein